jgi:hypothetical protein
MKDKEASQPANNAACHSPAVAAAAQGSFVLCGVEVMNARQQQTASLDGAVLYCLRKSGSTAQQS